MTPLLRLVLLFNMMCFSMLSKGQSCCEQDSVMTLCYLSANDYCISNNFNCQEYSLDGIFMKDALKLKLENPDYFGIQGKADCALKIEALPKNPSQFEFDNLSCDIIFLPSVPLNPSNERLVLEQTFLPESVLEEVHFWSTKCVDHLVIASQGETTHWGYEVKNFNQNPNQSVSLSEIFDGPFGSISSFDQGGTFKGVFVEQPSESTILAEDNGNRPTIILDAETNDLMLGDIGIFCGGNAGEISDGELINNNNDILALNIFALACGLAVSPTNRKQEVEFCDDPIILLDGTMVSDTGIFESIILGIGECDTTVTTKVIPCEKVTFPNIFSPNRDGRNDYFNLISDFEIEIEEFKIFNRWGQLVYDNERPETGWDGTYKGEAAPPGVYIYQVIYSNSLGTRRDIKMGDITLMR